MDALKRPVREALEAKRAAQDFSLLPYRDQSLVEAILALPQWGSTMAVAAYVSVPGEPDTSALLDAAWASGKAVWLPRVYGDSFVFVATSNREQLVSGPAGRLEPSLGSGLLPRTLGEIAPPIVLVPGLAFARTGARLGSGRGFYDRSLAPVRERTDIWRVGVCHATFLDPPLFSIAMENHDVPMHAVATEYGVVGCRPG